MLLINQFILLLYLGDAGTIAPLCVHIKVIGLSPWAWHFKFASSFTLTSIRSVLLTNQGGSENDNKIIYKIYKSSEFCTHVSILRVIDNNVKYICEKLQLIENKINDKSTKF